ncbi:MAG: plastocyanin/azurin family copper-binding protein [Solirubrobacterales bacterium]
MKGDLFYVLGISLVAFAMLTSLVGVRVSRFPASGAVMAATIAIFVALVAGTTTFAVLQAEDEQRARAEELTGAGHALTEGEPSPVGGGKAEGADRSLPSANGPGGSLKVAADPTQIAFDTTKLSTKPGKVTVDFDNPAPIEHDVAIEKDGEQIAVSTRIANGKASVSADLAPGTYTFLCTVPGHAEAGMEGTLVVK